MNRIPKSLGTPFLRDAIVELWFKPKVAANLLPGIFYERLRKEWQPPGGGIQSTIALNFQLTATHITEPIFTREGYQLFVRDSSVGLNIKGNYTGWKNSYYPLLERTLPPLLKGELVTPTQVSLRFVNDVPVPDIFALTNRFTSQGLDGFTDDQRTVRWTMKKGNISVVVNLAANVLGSTEGPERGSIVDVTLHRPLTKPEQFDLPTLLQLFDELHRLNKEIVFGDLLPESFTESFAPIY